MKAEKPIRKKAMIGGRMFDIIDTTREGELEKKLAEKNKELKDCIAAGIETTQQNAEYYCEILRLEKKIHDLKSQLRDEIKKISQDNGAYIRAYRKKVLELLEEKPKKIWG
jgi:uncharacterized protein YllA (UPF0747 family)